MNQLATTQGQALQAPTILGEAPLQIPLQGKIRAGVKVLKKAFSDNEQAVEIYQRGVDKGQPWDTIDYWIKQKLNQKVSVLVPKNVPYFTARGSDFTMPEVADKLMELYGEDKGDGEGVHLYRFPIILPLDNWQAIIPHGLTCYSRNELRYRSEYDTNGNRFCKMPSPVRRDPKNNRAIRPFGGRPWQLRTENDGVCAPEECPEYQSRACSLSGRIVFYVPGIPGTGALAIPTTSFYSLKQAREKLEMVFYARGGRISGMHNGKPIFCITKVQREVSMIDQSGNSKRVKQWLIELEADIDMTKVIGSTDDDDENLLEQGEHAQNLLNADEGPPF